MEKRGTKKRRLESTSSEDTVAGGKRNQTTGENQNGKMKCVFNVIGFRFLSVYIKLYNSNYIQ